MSTLNVGTIKSLGSSAPVFQNSSGVEKGQLAKAWIRFNGTGTVSISSAYGSFNISSITDNGTGNYLCSFTNNMSNINYVAMANAGRFAFSGTAANDYTVSAFKVRLSNINGDAEDRSVINAVVFGD
tara:strand:+ start:193 stop:573 length:381 start_codon:yes stop_codon:yes gene_type:complete